jgi:putative ABC transport system ATP-binding protein
MIELRGISKSYLLGADQCQALEGVDLDLRRTEFVALTGVSGSGKSTLMNILGCLDTPSAGSYRLDGEPVGGLKDDQLARVRNRKIGFIFQNFNLMPRMTALENVAQPLIYRGFSPSVRRQLAAETLKRVGLHDRLHHKPNELSGGQRQRVAIARALVGRPEVLLADEPTGNLDSRTAQEIMRLFTQLNSEGHTLVIVTHDPGIASHCKRVIRLHDGRIVEDRKNDPSGQAAAMKH